MLLDLKSVFRVWSDGVLLLGGSDWNGVFAFLSSCVQGSVVLMKMLHYVLLSVRLLPRYRFISIKVADII